MPYRITLLADGSQTVIDADQFVGRGDRLTFQQLPVPDRPDVAGIRRVATISLADLAMIEWLDDRAPG